MIDINGHIKISDFGLAKENFTNEMQSSSFCGSPEYLSPEMLINGKHSRMIDFYSLGVLMYELFTGLPPFYNNDHEIMFQSIMDEEP